MRERTGQELRQLRNRVGLTIKQVCELTSIPARTWYHWEDGSRKPPGIAFAFLEQHIELNELKGRQSPKE